MDSREKGEDRYKVNKSLQARIHACLDAGTDAQGLERTRYQTQEPMIGFFFCWGCMWELVFAVIGGGGVICLCV